MALMIPLEEATKIVAEAMTDAYERGRGIGEAERKVIEAAKAATVNGDLGRVLIRLGLVPSMKESVKRIIQTVEALLAAEGEE